MKKTILAIILALFLNQSYQTSAQSASNFATKPGKDKKDKKKDKNSDKPEDKKEQKGKDKSVVNKDAMFSEKNSSWVVGVHVGYPFVIGDVPPQFGIAYGFNVQKALGYSFALRAHFITGYSTGLNYQGNNWQSLQDNAAVNGVNNPASNYFAAHKPIFANYRMDFNKLSFDAVFYLNNINFNKENQRFLLYAVAGVGAFLYDTKVDQVDASGNMYDYSGITGGKYDKASTTYSQLKSLLDGKYETEADRPTGPRFLNMNLNPFVSAGVGGLYKVSDRVSLTLEATYGFTGSDGLDGQRWYGQGVPSSNPDAFSYINLGVNIKLGKIENVSWYSNPLSLPYKTLMDNKKKLEKVDKIEKQVAEQGKKLDSAALNLDSLLRDSDGDGVADYFDKEDSTPSGAIVDGAGRTIFFKDADGNLVYVDPNMANAVDNASNGGGNGNTGAGNINNAGNNGDGFGGNGNGNNNGGNTNFNNGTNSGKSTGNKKKGKTVFNKNSTAGKTIIYNNPNSKNSTNNTFVGTMSKFGLLPAVFFTTNSADLKQAYYPQLYEIAKLLRQNPGIKLHVIGYTDKRASVNYNQKLGMRRAKATEHALTAYFGVNPEQLLAESKGKVEPLTNATSMGAYAANRRVQFQIDGDNTGSIKGDLPEEKSVAKTKTVSTKTTIKSQPKTTKQVTKPQPKPAVKKVIKQAPIEYQNNGNADQKPASDQNNTPASDQNKTPADLNKTPADMNKTPSDTAKSKKDDIFAPGNDF